MRPRKRLAVSLVISLTLFIGLTALLANSSDSHAAAYSILHNFAGGAYDGAQPHYGVLVLSGSTLYGMNSDGPQSADPPAYHYSGTIYKINTDGSDYQFLHIFDDSPPIGDGTTPRGGLVLSGSTLYGCTAYGGLQGGTNGTVFRINTDGNGYQVLHSFSSDLNGEGNPYGAPVVSGSKLYGMTSSEASGGKGEIYAMNTDGSGFQVLRHFTGKPDDGHAPYGSLTLVGSRLYGMTSAGGSGGISGGGSGFGVIFAINTDSSNFQILHNFAGSPDDGNNPTGSLTLVGSRLYGMTGGGGANNGSGVIFSINLDGSDYRVVLDLSTVPGGVGGARGSLTLVGSKLYGMISGGGPGGTSGVIFRVNTDGSGFKVLHGFMPSVGDGGDPLGDLVFSGSMAYGYTYAGGSAGFGVIFACQTPGYDTSWMELLLFDQ